MIVDPPGDPVLVKRPTYFGVSLTPVAAKALKPAGPGIPISKYILRFLASPKNKSVTLKTATVGRTATGF